MFFVDNFANIFFSFETNYFNSILSKERGINDGNDVRTKSKVGTSIKHFRKQD